MTKKLDSNSVVLFFLLRPVPTDIASLLLLSLLGGAAATQPKWTCAVALRLRACDVLSLLRSRSLALVDLLLGKSRAEK